MTAPCPVPLDLMRAITVQRFRNPGVHPHTVALVLDPDGRLGLTAKRVQAAIEWLDAQPDGFADEED